MTTITGGPTVVHRRSPRTHGVRRTSGTQDVSATIGFSALSATVSAAANRRLHDRSPSKEQKDALVRMDKYLRELAQQMTGESDGSVPTQTQRQQRFALVRVAERSAPNDGPLESVENVAEVVEFVHSLADDTNLIVTWDPPDKGAATRVKTFFGDLAGSILTSVPLSGEYRTLLS